MGDSEAHGEQCERDVDVPPRIINFQAWRIDDQAFVQAAWRRSASNYASVRRRACFLFSTGHKHRAWLLKVHGCKVMYSAHIVAVLTTRSWPLLQFSGLWTNVWPRHY